MEDRRGIKDNDKVKGGGGMKIFSGSSILKSSKNNTIANGFWRN